MPTHLIARAHNSDGKFASPQLPNMRAPAADAQLPMSQSVCESTPATEDSVAVKTGSPWIFDPVRDLLLVIGTPILIIPGTLAFRAIWPADALILLVAAFGQVGHVLPGLIRAYGDRELFRRYQARFVVAPLLLFAACMFAVERNLHVLTLTAVTWAVWHALMQTYGFMRIYAAKSGCRSSVAAKLDLSMCLLWFGGAILLNDRPLMLMLERWYGSGGFAISAQSLSVFRSLWLAALAVATASYVVFHLRSGLRALRRQALKLMILGSSVGFYWYCYSSVSNLLVGGALFEVFHDVQYLSIVWLFNRKRVEQQSDVGGFVRFVFRRSGALVGLYVGMVFAFGGLKLLEVGLAGGRTAEILTGFLATAGLLHFYYDGFIWKIRDARNGRPLDVSEEADSPSRLNVPALVHGLKWTAGLVPIAVLTMIELATSPSQLDQYTLIASSLPECTAAHVQLADEQIDSGDKHAAARSLLVAADYNPNNVPLRLTLARTYLSINAPRDAEQQLRHVIRLQGDSADVKSNLGITLAQQGRWREAEKLFRESLRCEDSCDAHFNLANVLAEQRKFAESIEHYEQALRLNPRFLPAQRNLSMVRRAIRSAGQP